MIKTENGKLPSPTPSYRRVHKRSVLSLRAQILKQYMRDIQRYLAGRYVWNPAVVRFMKQKEAQATAQQEVTA